MATKSSSKGSRSAAPVTATRTGAGPDVQAGGGQGLSGEPPQLSSQRHGGAALEGSPPQGVTPTAGAAADTGPVVEGTGGGLAFERKPSGSRAQPRKEQPTVPERAEIIEARRLEQEITQSKSNDAFAAAGKTAKVGDRIRVMRSAATGWEMGTLKYVAGASGSAELDGGEIVGLEAGRWEPAVGALAAPMLDSRDLKEHGGLIDREGQDAAANLSEAVGNTARSAQTSAKPSRAKAKSGAKRSGKSK